MPERERCPGTGAYARDLAGNPRGSCHVCGKSCKLTKRGTIRHHKSLLVHTSKPLAPSPPSLQERYDGLLVCFQAAQADRDFFRKECFSLQGQLQEALTEIDNLMMQMVVMEMQ